MTKLNGECFGPATPGIPSTVDPPPNGYPDAQAGSPHSPTGRVVDRAARNLVPRCIPLLKRLSLLQTVTEILQVLQLLSGFGGTSPSPRSVRRVVGARERLPIQRGEGQFDTPIASRERSCANADQLRRVRLSLVQGLGGRFPVPYTTHGRLFGMRECLRQGTFRAERTCKTDATQEIA